MLVVVVMMLVVVMCDGDDVGGDQAPTGYECWPRGWHLHLRCERVGE